MNLYRALIRLEYGLEYGFGGGGGNSSTNKTGSKSFTDASPVLYKVTRAAKLTNALEKTVLCQVAYEGCQLVPTVQLSLAQLSA